MEIMLLTDLDLESEVHRLTADETPDDVPGEFFEVINGLDIVRW